MTLNVTRRALGQYAKLGPAASQYEILSANLSVEPLALGLQGRDHTEGTSGGLNTTQMN